MNTTLQLSVPASIETVAAEARTLTGVIAAYSQLATGHNLRLAPGSLKPRQPYKRVKLLVDHDKGRPIGYMTDYDPDTLRATFTIPETPAGDAALADARAGLRDGFSVGFAAEKWDIDTAGVLDVTAAEMYEVSLVAIPAIASAQVDALTAALSARTERSDMHENSESTQPESGKPEVETGLAVNEYRQASSPTASLQVSSRGYSLQAAVAKVAAAMSTQSPNDVRLALADVLPADDAGKGWLREDWLGQLFQASPEGRPFIDSFGPTSQLKSLKMKGWAWEKKPKPGKWKGEKTAVPTGKIKTKPIEGEAERWAGGWDIDRIYVDLGEPGFLEAFWAAAIAEYKRDSDSDVAAKVKAAAGDKNTSTGVLAAIADVASTLRKIGARVSTIWLAENLWEQYSALKQSEVPFWLANATGVSLIRAEATVADLQIGTSSHLADGELLAYDRRAATVYEKTPIRVQAQDISKGGIDLGFFSYGGVLVSDPRAICLREITPPAPTAQAGQ